MRKREKRYSVHDGRDGSIVGRYASVTSAVVRAYKFSRRINYSASIRARGLTLATVKGC